MKDNDSAISPRFTEIRRALPYQNAAPVTQKTISTGMFPAEGTPGECYTE